MFDFVFILSILTFLLYESWILTDPGRIDLLIKKTKRHPLRYRQQSATLGLVSALYLVWTIIGSAYATNWIPFFILLCLGIVQMILKRLVPAMFPAYRFFDAAVCIGLILYIFISHYR
jgi:hypothetical protein